MGTDLLCRANRESVIVLESQDINRVHRNIY